MTNSRKGPEGSVDLAANGRPHMLASGANHGAESTQRIPVLLVFGLAFLVSATYVLLHLETGWLPQDDGSLAQNALHVLQGQLPHRDFLENYTGGVSYIHSFAFRVFGTNLASLRICLFIFFLAWLPAVFFAAARFTSTVAAGGVTVLAAVWAIPQYPAPMPSWYNLFLATFGAVALLHYLEAGGKRWLFVAGLCGGTSILMKVIGLYYVAAVLLFFVFVEQNRNRAGARPGRTGVTYRLFSLAALLAFLAAVLFLMRNHFDDREFTHFFLPIAALVAAVISRELREPRGSDGARFSALFSMVLPFLAGVVTPLALFLVPYLWSGSLNAFWSGAFGGGLRTALAISGLRPPRTILGWPMLLLVLLLATAVFWRPAAKPSIGILVAAVLAVLLLVPRTDVWEMIWNSALFLTPAVVVAGAIFLIRTPNEQPRDCVRSEQLMLMLAIAAVCGLVQFPFSAPIYFCYFAPLLALALVAVLSVVPRPASPVILAAVLTFYALFAVIRLAPAEIYAHWGVSPDGDVKVFAIPAQSERTMHLPRSGGLKVPVPELYETLVPLIQQHAKNGLLLATPESPALYFLTGLHSPTGNELYLVRSPAEITNAIQADKLYVVVINTGSSFSGSTLTPELRQAIESRFPQLTTVGRYWVYWRE